MNAGTPFDTPRLYLVKANRTERCSHGAELFWTLLSTPNNRQRDHANNCISYLHWFPGPLRLSQFSQHFFPFSLCFSVFAADVLRFVAVTSSTISVPFQVACVQIRRSRAQWVSLCIFNAKWSLCSLSGCTFDTRKNNRKTLSEVVKNNRYVTSKVQAILTSGS